MEVKTQSKWVRMSPQKGREVLYLIKGKKALHALEILKFVPQRPAKTILKAIKTAVADAEHNFRLRKEDLYIKTVAIDKAGSMKRFRPRAKGAASSILKRLSHITVILKGEEKLGKEEIKKLEAVKEKQVEKRAAEGEGKQVKSLEVAQDKGEEIRKEPVETSTSLSSGQAQGKISKPEEKGVIRRIFRRKSI